MKEANCGHYTFAPFITSPCDVCDHAAPVTITDANAVVLSFHSTSLSRYGSSDSKKSPALGIATVSEPRLIITSGESARRSVCCCNRNGGGASITAEPFTSVARI